MITDPPINHESASVKPMIAMTSFDFIPTIQWVEWCIDTLIHGDYAWYNLKIGVTCSISYYYKWVLKILKMSPSADHGT